MFQTNQLIKLKPFMHYKYSLKIYLILYLLTVFSQSVTTCGDGIIQLGQICDDTNTINGDGCDSNCNIQPDYRCMSAPSICKIDIVINLKNLGNHRITNKNSVVFIFILDYDLEVFCKIDFKTIFKTTVPSSNLEINYDCRNNILTSTIDFTENIQNVFHSFQLNLGTTTYFWYDSDIYQTQLDGVNCQLTYHQNIQMYNMISYILIAFICFAIIIGFISIFCEKWIGLELIQTYQTVFYMFLFLQEFPYQLRFLIQSLRYSNGYDDLFSDDYLRQCKLSNELNGLSLQKQFLLNFNLSLGIIGIIIIILIIFALKRLYLKNMLQSEINRKISRDLQKNNTIFTFIFGQIFMFVILTFMFKIISTFLIQLSAQEGYNRVYQDQTNITIAAISFLLLFTVIIYIINWYIMTPDNLTENQRFNSLQFKNMKFSYPIIYLLYQTIFIFIVLIYYHKTYTIYVILSLQVCYLLFIIKFCPYNTPRKINRILHNFTICYNQFIAILTNIIILRWRGVLSGNHQLKSNRQFEAYSFFIAILLIIAIILAIIRLVIFNKDVNCTKDDLQDIPNRQSINNKNDENEQISIKNISLNFPYQKTSNRNLKDRQMKDISFQNQNQDQIFSKFLNEKYINWVKYNSYGMANNKKENKKYIKTTARRAQLIKTPLQQFLQLQRLKSDDNQIN